MAESRTYGQASNMVYESAETEPLAVEEKKNLLIVCSSDKGLCGGVHSGISRTVRRMLAQTPNYDLVVLGEKCKSQLSRTNANNIVMSVAGIGKSVPTFADAQSITDRIVMLPEEYASIKIVYNRFINASSYEPKTVEAFSEEALRESRRFFLLLFLKLSLPIPNLFFLLFFFDGSIFCPHFCA